MKRISLHFTHEGKDYNGELSEVQGAGTTAVYHLTINNYYRGRLRVSAFDERWIFDGEFASLAEPLGQWVLLVNWIKQELTRGYGELVLSLLTESDE